MGRNGASEVTTLWRFINEFINISSKNIEQRQLSYNVHGTLLQKAQVPLDDYEIEKVLFRLDAGKEGKISYQ